MTLKEAILTLEHYQKWRLGAEIEPTEPKKLTEALECVLNIVKKF